MSGSKDLNQRALASLYKAGPQFTCNCNISKLMKSAILYGKVFHLIVLHQQRPDSLHELLLILDSLHVDVDLFHPIELFNLIDRPIPNLHMLYI